MNADVLLAIFWLIVVLTLIAAASAPTTFDPKDHPPAEGSDERR